MKTFAALFLVALATPFSAATVSGPAHVIDGDTLEIDGQRIRLFGIDAPEGMVRPMHLPGIEALSVSPSSPATFQIRMRLAENYEHKRGKLAPSIGPVHLL